MAAIQQHFVILLIYAFIQGGKGLKVESRGHSSGHSGGHGHGWPSYGGHGHGHGDQNLDLYSLLGGLSFASLLGATIVFLARRNTSGRRRRSLDGKRYLEEDEEEDDFVNGIHFSDIIQNIARVF